MGNREQSKKNETNFIAYRIRFGSNKKHKNCSTKCWWLKFWDNKCIMYVLVYGITANTKWGSKNSIYIYLVDFDPIILIIKVERVFDRFNAMTYIRKKI